MDQVKSIDDLDSEKNGHHIISWKRLLVTAGAVVALCGSLLLIAFTLRGVHDQSLKNKRAVIALCALRTDLDRRITASQIFLNEHPEGLDGLTASVIRQSLNNSKRTRRTLHVLDCQGGGTP